MKGICGSPNFWPSQAEIDELKPDFLRTIIYTYDDVRALKKLNIPVMITLNNQCQEVGSDWLGWKSTVSNICDMLGSQLLLLGCGNELDMYKDTPPEFAADLVLQAYKVTASKGVKIAPTSVASSNWVDYLQRLAPLCKNYVDFFDIHPYGKRPDTWGSPGWMFGDLRETINTVRDITGKDVICSEYGVKVRDAGSTLEVAKFLASAYTTMISMNVPYWSWFAWTDEVGAPSERGADAFGMRAADGSHRPAWDVYERLSGGSETTVPFDKYAQWHGRVGDGLLAMMKQDNSVPIMASEWRPFDRPSGEAATVEECIADNGWTYRWLLPLDKGFRDKAE